MRAVIQRVSSASVISDDVLTGSIEKGLLVLVGIENEDLPEDAEWLGEKVRQMRIFSDDDGKMNLSVQDVKGRLLIISQFTLHASTKKGNRPSFIKAARPEYAIELYNHFIKYLEFQTGEKVATGIFGADMQINLINDGPVTIIIDSKNKE